MSENFLDKVIGIYPNHKQQTTKAKAQSTTNPAKHAFLISRYLIIMYGGSPIKSREDVLYRVSQLYTYDKDTSNYQGDPSHIHHIKGLFPKLQHIAALDTYSLLIPVKNVSYGPNINITTKTITMQTHSELCCLQKTHGFLVRENRDEILVIDDKNPPLDAIMRHSHQIHKTILIDHPGPNNTIIQIKIGMLTSAKNYNTIMLSETQEINKNLLQKDKEQRFQVFSNFLFIVDDDLSLLKIDKDAMEYLKGKHILYKVKEAFENRQNIWSNNHIQKPMIITKETLHKIVLHITKENKEKFEQEFEEEKQIELDKLQKKKDKMVLLQKESLYFSLFRVNYTFLSFMDTFFS